MTIDSKHNGKGQPETEDYGVSWEWLTSNNRLGTMNNAKEEETKISNILEEICTISKLFIGSC